jgi:hypothetical protein
MSSEPETWTIEHFTQANPAGPGQDDVPALLRRVAAALEGMGTVEVQDVVFHSEVTEHGDWPSVTVYLHRVRPHEPQPDPEPQRRVLRSVKTGSDMP